MSGSAAATAFPTLLADLQARVEQALAARLPPPAGPCARLHEAMRYAVLGGGKRVRPLLCYLSGQALGVPLEELDGPAAALEMIHAYSLIHDDLPAMDDDDLRRGRPTTHVAFDEATAILAGDSLQVLAFEVLATAPHMTPDPARRLTMVARLASGSGTAGMAGGQAIDLAAVGRRLALQEVEQMHGMKTGALIEASAGLGVAAAGDPPAGACLMSYARSLGLAFQIVDDLLDAVGDASLVGKPVRADAAADKPTYPRIAGIEAARERAQRLHREALEAIEPLGSAAAEPLRLFAGFLLDRDR
ncbi:MAG: polyprenyl synthetase family protein [Steroidobacteraceae bacterium]